MKESQDNMFPHSEAKIRLLKLYLERYLNILDHSPYVGDIYLFDLFCGEGIYSNGGKGSPIVMLETIANLAKNSKGENSKTLHCHFNDIVVEKTEKVRKAITENKLVSPRVANVSFTNQDYQVLVPDIENKINSFKKEKAFVFIDPYGYKEIRINDIQRLLRNKKTEVLLFLPTHFMFRFEEKGTPESLVEFINELMPIEKWPISETGIEFIENLTDAFRRTLGEGYYVDSFIITREKNQFFCLFFFTSHIYGFDRMLDAKWEIDAEEGRGWSYESDYSLFANEKTPNTVKFENRLIQFLKEDARNNGEIYEFTLRSGHLPKHANDILIELQKQNRISVVSNLNPVTRTGAFYLNYQNYRDNPTKILVKYN